MNEEISHSKGHFSHPGSCNRIPYLHHADNRMRVQLAGCETVLRTLNLRISTQNTLKVRKYVFANKKKSANNRMREKVNKIIIVFLLVHIRNFEIIKT